MSKRIVCLLCAVCLVLVGCSGGTGTPEQQEPAPDAVPAETAITRKALDAYTWDELSRISAQIAAADDETARAIATNYGLVEEDGTLTAQTKQIVLNGSRAFDVRLAGFRHDDKADGSGRAGLVFMTVGALDIRPMNDSPNIDGGWEGSSLRAWLATEGKAMLPSDLAAVIVPVNKVTNNVGITENPEDVTVTADELWPFSVREVCGDVHWDEDEYLGKRGDGSMDAMLNAEGNQYEVFSLAGVTDASAPNGALSLESSTGASAWWYRTPYPFDWVGYGPTGASGYFYQVTPSGYPESLGSPEVPAAVVVGFCV